MPVWKDLRDRLLNFCLPVRERQHDHRQDLETIDVNMDKTTRPKGTPKPEWIETFAELSDEEAIMEFSKQFEDELELLKTAESTIERNDQPTIGADSDGLTPSKRIFGEDYPEVNRTCVSMLCLKWLMTRNYDAFTANQPQPVKMSRESFDVLCNLASEPTRVGTGSRAKVDRQAFTALLVAVVVGDIGKDKNFEQSVLAKVQQRNLDALAHPLNHDEILYLAAQQGLIPSMKRLLRPEYQDIVLLGLRAGSLVNVSQLAQAENVPGSLRPIEVLKGRQQAFLLKYLEVILDVSGAGGHIDSRSALRMIEPVFQAYATCRYALEDIIAGRKNLRQAYDQVLQQRGKLLDAKGFKRLSATIPSERALLRLMCMGRVDNPQNAGLMATAFDGMRNTSRQKLIDGLSVDGIEDGEAILLYYIPGVFAETFKIMRESSNPRKIEALRSVMRFMVKVYGGSKPQPGQPGKITERNVGLAAKDIIATDEFKHDPSILDGYDLVGS
ncbi:hypothetical protein UCRPC4_g06335 [Phaeomoniella chlamydospora]|uniref:Uncharacterized protein n=1 Tax=Phaeomoniella chlamydospora TaxID=158046 RepID=A0A0G2DXA4_PHACM|nr:hypothetical protein UCRPC4_g06335 [Phaeomoniella chlamydospora]